MQDLEHGERRGEAGVQVFPEQGIQALLPAQIFRGRDRVVQRPVAHRRLLGVGRPEVIKPRHEHLYVSALGVKLRPLIEQEFAPRLADRAGPVDVCREAQHVAVVFVEQPPQPAPNEVVRPFRRARRHQAALLVLLSAAAGAGVVAAGLGH